MSDEQISEPILRPPGVMVNRRVGSDAEGWTTKWMPAMPAELLSALEWHLNKSGITMEDDG